MKTEFIKIIGRKGLVCVLCLCLILEIVLISGGNRVSAADAPLSQDRYLTSNRLNQLRSSLGLRTLTISETLNEAIGNHCSYMKEHQKAGPIEQKGTGFTGILPSDRAQYAGFQGNVLEIDRNLVQSYDELIDQALHDPADRYCLLYPMADEIGYGMNGDYAGVLIGSSRRFPEEYPVVIYPSAGQQLVGNIPLSLLPDVPEDVTGSAYRKLIGEVITVTCYSGQGDPVQVRNLSFTLKDTRHDSTLPCTVVLQEEDLSQANTITIYPRSIYLADTRYEASICCDLWQNGRFLRTIRETWSFTSSGPDSIGEVSREEALASLTELFGKKFEEEEIHTGRRFSDVPFDLSDETSLQIYGLLQEGVLSGFNDGKQLHLSDAVTREQAAAWMMRMLHVWAPDQFNSVTISYETTFKDINRCSRSNRGLVQRAYQLGLVADQGGEMFSPEVYITQTEFSGWMAALKELLPETAEEAAENAAEEAG